MQKNLLKIQEFENDLDQTLESLPSIQCNGEECIKLASILIEECYSSKNNAFAEQLDRGLNILAPYFIKNRGQVSPDIEQLTSDLFFAGHYYMLREYLYYTYNSPDSFLWGFDESKVGIKFNDPTIPRQFFLQANNYFLGSLELFSDYEVGEQIIEQLKDQDEFSPSPRIAQVLELIEKETDIKFASYYNFLPSSSDIDLGGYKYNQFYQVFRSLVTKALYHRYHCRANGVSGPIFMLFDELVRDLSTETGFPSEVCSAIIDDLSYSVRAERERIQPLYFSLYHLVNCNQILMLPHHFATWEGLINILRVLALRKPQLFLETLNPILSDSFLSHIESMFSSQGFTCIKNIKLDKFDKALPDIDLLVISEEPTFGYFLYCCEVKNPIPPQWAKDHLRVLNKDSVSKSFKQMGLITKFLNTESGVLFLRSVLPQDGLPNFGDQFLIGCSGLVITSRNAGMFFADHDQTVIDYQTLDRILKKCDGDVTYISWALKNIENLAEEGLRVVPIEFKVGSRTVTYQVIQVASILDFQQNEYKSKGIDKQIADEFIEDGHHPFDTIGKQEK